MGGVRRNADHREGPVTECQHVGAGLSRGVCGEVAIAEASVRPDPFRSAPPHPMPPHSISPHSIPFQCAECPGGAVELADASVCSGPSRSIPFHSMPFRSAPSHSVTVRGAFCGGGAGVVLLLLSASLASYRRFHLFFYPLEKENRTVEMRGAAYTASTRNNAIYRRTLRKWCAKWYWRATHA